MASTGAPPRVEVYGLRLPVLEGPCDPAELVARAAEEQGVGIRDGDIVAVTCKLLSKCLGYTVRIDEVEPSPLAEKIARKTGEDPRFVELVLRESDDVLFVVSVKKLAEKGVIDLTRFSRSPEAARRLLEDYPVLFFTLREGEIWSDAGIDGSNHPPGVYSVPPRRLDDVARRMRERIMELTGRRVAVVACDTEVFTAGSLDIARGSYGLEPVSRGFGEPDLYGKPKYGGVDAVAHEVCAAAALVMGQARQGVPAVILRGVGYEECECGMHDRIRGGASRLPALVRAIVWETGRVLGWGRLASRLWKTMLGRG